MASNAIPLQTDVGRWLDCTCKDWWAVGMGDGVFGGGGRSLGGGEQVGRAARRVLPGKVFSGPPCNVNCWCTYLLDCLFRKRAPLASHSTRPVSWWTRARTDWPCLTKSIPHVHCSQPNAMLCGTSRLQTAGSPHKPTRSAASISPTASPPARVNLNVTIIVMSFML